MKVQNITSFNYINNVRNNRVSNYQSHPQVESSSSNALLPAIPVNYMANISFKGLNGERVLEFTSEMGKRIYSKRHVTNLSRIYSDADGITAGRGLPEEWLNRIPNLEDFDQDSFIKDFGKIFSEERKFADVDRVKEKLSKLFKKHQIIDDNTPFSVRYIGHGFQAWAYRIGIGNDDSTGVVAKLFKRHNNYLQNHGNHTEQNLAEYIKEYAGDTPMFVKYYYGDTQNGLMLTKYLKRVGEVNVDQKVTTAVDLEDYGIDYGDPYLKNIINGQISDFGGIVTVSNLVGNKTAQQVHKAIKYAQTPEEKIEIFNKIFSEKADTDEFKDKAIGLVHSIKHLPEEMQPELYIKCHDIGSHRVNIALIQNIKNFGSDDSLKALTKTLIDNANVDPKELENIAKEIKAISGPLAHKFFEDMQDTKISSIIKYLARNMNLYFKDMSMRMTIYDKFVENSDNYAAVSLINSMNCVSKSLYAKYYERFFAKNDDMVNTTLARSLSLLDDDPVLQRKWIDKLMACNSENVNAGLAEAIRFIDKDMRAQLFEKLLPIEDRVTKEFLAQNITQVPWYYLHPEYVEKLMKGADNMLRGALIDSMKNIDGTIKLEWAKIIKNGADNTIIKMLDDVCENVKS